jgi:hypothetical protein
MSVQKWSPATSGNLQVLILSLINTILRFLPDSRQEPKYSTSPASVLISFGHCSHFFVVVAYIILACEESLYLA